MRRGLLLFAHGARDARWAEPFEAVAARIRERAPDVELELAYLEFMAPGIVEAGERLALAGCQEIDLVPLFLGAGGHVRRDMPLLLAELQAAHPLVQWRLRTAIGEVPRVIDAMAEASLAFVEPASPDA